MSVYHLAFDIGCIDYSTATVEQINTVAAILGKARAATDNAVRALGGAS